MRNIQKNTSIRTISNMKFVRKSSAPIGHPLHLDTGGGAIEKTYMTVKLCARCRRCHNFRPIMIHNSQRVSSALDEETIGNRNYFDHSISFYIPIVSITEIRMVKTVSKSVKLKSRYYYTCKSTLQQKRYLDAYRLVSTSLLTARRVH